MSPRKKKRNLQPAEITEPATEKKLDCSDCNSNLQPFPSSSTNIVEPATERKASSSSSMTPDWSLLPGELLHVISQNLDNCFDFVNARSVCNSWRSTFPFPSCLLRLSYSLPSFGEYPYESDDLCTLEKIPLFLFRVQTPPASPSEYCLGGVGRDESGDHMELPSPIQCSVKVKFPGSVPTVMNIHDNQILPLGHHYRMIGWDPESWTTDYRGVALLPLNKDGREEFVLLLNYTKVLLMLRSDERKWVQLKKISDASCFDLVAFRGRFYMAFLNGDVFFFDPYALKVSRLMPSPPLRSINYLVPSGDDELFLVENFNPFPDSDVIDFKLFTCRVCRLDEEAGKWVVVTELGDRVLFIGHFGNVCCSAKELPDGCGVSGNSIVFTNEPGNVTYAFKYGVHTGREEDDLNIWRYSKDNRVNILSTSPVVSLRVQRQAI